MNYIFLTNQYLPKPGATGLCVHYIARELALKGHNVSVICYSEGEPSVEMIDSINIVKISIPFFLQDCSHRDVFVQKFCRYSSLFHKFYHFQTYPFRSSVLRNRFYKSACEIIDKEEPLTTTVIASYTPVEACSALIKLKKTYPELKTCFYSTDTLSNEQGGDGFLSAKMRTEKGLKWEFKIFESVDRCIIMECHKLHYMKDEFKAYHKKMVFANFPLLREPEQTASNRKNNNDPKFMVYAGTLYRVLRNPSFICDLLAEVAKYQTISVAFMGSGDCGDIMRKYEKVSAGAIRFLGMQPHTIASKQIQDADILLSIGNAESPMAPSKIFEYMATGKPIIHTYKWDKDPCIEPLKKYGNALLIDERVTPNINSVILFIAESKVMPFKEVAKRFESSLPKFTAALIENL